MLIERRNDQVEHDEYMLATIAWAMCGGEQSRDDFMPSRWKKREAEQAQADRAQALAKKIEALFGIHNQKCQAK